MLSDDFDLDSGKKVREQLMGLSYCPVCGTPLEAMGYDSGVPRFDCDCCALCYKVDDSTLIVEELPPDPLKVVKAVLEHRLREAKNKKGRLKSVVISVEEANTLIKLIEMKEEGKS